jgi:type II secretory pathway pseudopilin PulG
MLIGTRHSQTRLSRAATAFGFTLVEVMVSVLILVMVVAGVCYGYSQANRIAIWESMSQAAESYAVQGMEQSRAALWNPWDWVTNQGPGTEDEWPPGTPFAQQDLLDIPMKGNPFATNAGGAFTNYSFFVTNYVYVTTITNYSGGYFPSPLRQIKSVAVWTFPFTGKGFTNTVITLRASDQ